MAITVNVPFDFALEVYTQAFENDGIPPHVVWKLRSYLDVAAQDLLLSIAQADLEDTVEILKHHTLQEVHDDQDLVPVEYTQVASVWWLLHRNLLDLNHL